MAQLVGCRALKCITAYGSRPSGWGTSWVPNRALLASGKPCRTALLTQANLLPQKASMEPKASAARLSAPEHQQKQSSTLQKGQEVEVLAARWAMLGVVWLILQDALGSGQPSGPPPPFLLLLLAAVGASEYMRAAAVQGQPDREQGVYPGPLIRRRRHSSNGNGSAGAGAGPGLGVFSSWLGGLPGWLSGGWWYGRPELTEGQLERQKVAELKHGRLAMVALAGICAAWVLTGVGPIDALLQLVSGPAHTTAVGLAGTAGT